MRVARGVVISCRSQRGFVDRIVMALGMLLVLALAGRFLYWGATEEEFGLLAGILWAIALMLAYWLAHDDVLVAHMPAGIAVFLGLSIITMPLTWLGQSRIALVALLVAQLAFCYHAGRVLTGHLTSRVLPRYAGGRVPAWLEQDRDIVLDLGKWGVLVFAAVVLLVVLPLIALLLITLAVDLSQQQTRWLAAAWGFCVMVWFGLSGGGTKWAMVPAGAAIYLIVTAAVLAVDAVAGPFTAGTGVQVAYTTLPGALIVATVEVFVFGAARRMENNQKEDSA